MNSTISFTMLWKIFKEVWFKILIITLALMLAAGLFTEFVITKKYTSTVKFYVINTYEDQSFEQEAIYKTKELLATEYIEVILSDKILIPLSEQLAEYDIEYTPRQLQLMISSKKTAELGIFDIIVTHPDPETAYRIATIISEISPDIVKQIKRYGMENQPESMLVLNAPKKAEAHSSPSLVRNVLLVGILSAVAAYALFFFLNLFDNVIKSGDDLKPFTEKYPLLGTIPVWREDK